VRYKYQEADLLFRRTKFDKISIYAGPSLYAYQNEYEDNKKYILGSPSLVKIDSANIYQNKIYAGIKAGININNLNNELFPTRGIEWNNQFTYLKGFNSNSNSLTKVETNMTVYASLKMPAKVVGVIKLGGGRIFNDSLQFFQAMYLGQNNILRGFRKNRFAGHGLAYGSLELRVKLFDSKSYFFPGQVGLIAFDDVGRVWYKGERSQRWHNTYGAGLYFIPFNLTIVSATVGLSDDGKIFNFSIGTKFNITF
jgi:outer membrane translocation and assembly module TamA